MFTTGSASEFDVLAVDDIEELFDDCHFLIDQLVIATLVFGRAGDDVEFLSVIRWMVMDVLVGSGIGTSFGGRRCTHSKSFGADPEAKFG